MSKDFNPFTKNNFISYVISSFCSWGEQREKGTTLVTAVALGLIALGGATLAIVKASQNKTNTASDEQTKQVLAITESGVSNLMAQLTKPTNRSLLLRNFDPDSYLSTDDSENKWTLGTSEELQLSPPSPNSCANPTARETTDSLNVLTVNSSDGSVQRNKVSIGEGSSSGKYQFLAYRYQKITDTSNGETGIGRLLIEGELDKNINTKSRIEVSFPVTLTNDLGGETALIANQINLQQSDAITSGIICTNPALCPITCLPNQTSPTSPQLKTAIGGSDNNAVVHSIFKDGSNPAITKILVGSMTIPPTPAIPLGIIPIPLGDITDNISLPRAGDASSNIDVDNTAKSVYYYEIGDLTKSSITLTDSTAEYRIYISGAVEQTGNDDIKLSGSGVLNGAPKPGQVRIYGNSTSDENWLFGGNSCTMAFIHAPKANIGINGGGNGCSNLRLENAVADGNLILNPDPKFTINNFVSPEKTNFYGGVWANSYNVIGNNSNAGIFYEQPGLMNVIRISMGGGFPQFEKGYITVDNISSFTRKPL